MSTLKLRLIKIKKNKSFNEKYLQKEQKFTNKTKNKVKKKNFLSKKSL